MEPTAKAFADFVGAILDSTGELSGIEVHIMLKQSCYDALMTIRDTSAIADEVGGHGSILNFTARKARAGGTL